MPERFIAPPDAWAGETTFILGGGPSLRAFDCDQLKGHGRVIAVNDAGLYKAPWADVLFWADQRWLEWNQKKLGLHTGPLKITRKRPHVETRHDIKVMRFLPSKFSHAPDAVGGWCGGSSAINLAYLLGSRLVVLLGFDMRPGNWHSNHKMPPVPNQHRDRFIPTIESMAPHLSEAGVKVFNATPDSALKCFPIADIEEFIHGPS